MTAYELLYRLFPEKAQKTQEKFPEFMETAREIEVIPWQDEFAVADKNPEVIDEIEFWNTLLDGGLISEEEWKEKVRKAGRGYASKTVGIAFIKERQVSFRTEVPPFHVIIHEIGHVHYEEVDTFWSATYGGGEILFHLGLSGKYKIREKNVRHFHNLYRLAYEDHKAFADLVVEKIAPYFGDQITPHFYPICLFSGWLAEGAAKAGILDVKDQNWFSVEILRQDVLAFVQELTAGLQFDDPFWYQYSKLLGIVD